ASINCWNSRRTAITVSCPPSMSSFPLSARHFSFKLIFGSAAAPVLRRKHPVFKRNRSHARRWIKPMTHVSPSISTTDHPLLGEGRGEGGPNSNFSLLWKCFLQNTTPAAVRCASRRTQTRGQSLNRGLVSSTHANREGPAHLAPEARAAFQPYSYSQRMGSGCNAIAISFYFPFITS